MRGRQRPVLFMVFGNQRTGSTLVASKLNSHPRIVCHEEVFLPWLGSDPSLRDWLDAKDHPQWLRAVPGVRTSFLNELLNINDFSNDVSAIGFKVMYNQMALWPKFAYLAPRAGRLLQDHALQRWLRINRVIIVHTLRRNYLKILVSHQLAAQSQRYHSRDPAVGSDSIVVPLRGLKARLRRIEMAERVARHTIRDLPTIEIFYEEYMSDRGPEQDARLCASLGLTLPEAGLSTQLTKVASDDLRDTVANYDQVAACLSGTRFEHFLR